MRPEPLETLPNTCDEAEESWDPAWIRCPVCQVMPDQDDALEHKKPSEVVQ